MAGGALKYRHLGRKSSHRQALLRNLVTSLFTHESISTTWPKAKEAQRLAEKVITLAKKNTDTSRRKAQAIFYVRPQIFFSFPPSFLFPSTTQNEYIYIYTYCLRRPKKREGREGDGGGGWGCSLLHKKIINTYLYSCIIYISAKRTGDVIR